MSQAFNEIGINKAFRFGIYTLLMEFYKLLIFPQLRTPFLRIIGASIGRNVIIHPVSFFNYYRYGFPGLTIGDNCFIGNDCMIDLAERVTFEQDVTLAERVTIITHQNVGYQSHPLQRNFPAEAKPITIKSGSFIGASATVLPGVEVARSRLLQPEVLSQKMFRQIPWWLGSLPEQ